MCRRVFFEVIDEEEEERQYRVIMRSVGLPPQERHGPEGSLTWQGVRYDYFVRAAAEQYQESLREARAFFERRSESYQPHHVESHATAIRTLPAREMFLYAKFAREGALPPVAAPIRGPMAAAQLEALFQELRTRDAFHIELHPFASWHNLTDREMWLRHREEGESYSTWEGGFWSLSLA